MHVRSVIIEAHTLIYREKVIVRKSFLFGNKGDHVLTEAVYTHIKPKPEYSFDFFPDEGIVHIQIGLLDGEQVQIIFPTHLIPLPGRSFKIALPVIRELSVRLCGPPDIVIRVGRDPLTALLKPFVLIAGMIDHEIHQQLHSAAVQAFKDSLEGLHTAERRIDIHIIRNIISAICSGRGING